MKSIYPSKRFAREVAFARHFGLSPAIYVRWPVVRLGDLVEFVRRGWASWKHHSAIDGDTLLSAGDLPPGDLLMDEVLQAGLRERIRVRLRPSLADAVCNARLIGRTAGCRARTDRQGAGCAAEPADTEGAADKGLPARLKRRRKTLTANILCFAPAL